MKYLSFLFFLSCFSAVAQPALPFDSLKIAEVKNLFVDDYQNFYFYSSKDFSFSKFDSLGKNSGEIRLTLPHKIQDIQNPLNIILFSENAQEIRMVDQHLVEIQKIDLSKFGFVKMAYVEDQQDMWLLEESTKRLLQYRFRQEEIRHSYQIYFALEKVKDMIVYSGNIYVLSEDNFEIHNLRGGLLFSYAIEDAKRLRRENHNIIIISKNKIIKINEMFSVETLFSKPEAQIVDKNSTSFFAVTDNKIYLYPIIKEKIIVQK